MELLKQQHDEVDEMMAQLEGAIDRERKREIFAKLADALAAHAKIEETLFYPAVLRGQTDQILLESAEEHLAIKRVLADLVDMDVEDDNFDAKLNVMKEEIRHHAREEEEGKLFPEVKKILSDDDLEALGGELTRMFVELTEDDARLDVRNETDRAAPI